MRHDVLGVENPEEPLEIPRINVVHDDDTVWRIVSGYDEGFCLERLANE